MKIKKGDKVKVLRGKDRGKTGVVKQVFSKKGELLVDGVNLYKKHQKPRREGDQSGGIIDKVRPLAISKVALICPKCAKITKVGFLVSQHKKVRVCRACKAEI
ncbi:MAG TPA: 50S ribosomal protein L24 [Clostridia bacterium]|nr:50S ribosomal protein L24 [Clostridia bacterium]